jgi:hypothetical protein
MVLPGGDIAERRYPSATVRRVCRVWADAARQLLTGALAASWGGIPPNLDIKPVVIRGEPRPALVEVADSSDD